MGLVEAKKYIQDLHKKQNNPYLWPDYLTGLPDKSAIIKEMDEVFPTAGEYSISYIRIANIQPYLLKYGPDKHAEIIQWAAAILKTTYDKCPHSFIGAFNTHDFVGMCKTKNMVKLFEEAQEMFRKKAAAYYSKNDLAKGITLSFDKNDGEKVSRGLMKLIAVVADKKLKVKKSQLIRNMTRICEAIEGTKDEIVVMNNDMILKD
jgi:GGDEF domain-containing protein